MNKFGLMDEEPEEIAAAETTTPPSLQERLAAFPPAARRQALDLEQVDAAAAAHGFVSREPAPRVPAVAPLSALPQPQFGYAGRRRRVVPTEATRHLAIRLPESQYERFVAYADSIRLTYHEALIRLMDEAGH